MCRTYVVKTVKMLRKEIKRNISERETYHFHRLESSSLLRCQFHTKSYIELTQFIPKFQRNIFINIDEIILKFIWKEKGTRINKVIFFKKEKSRRN